MGQPELSGRGTSSAKHTNPYAESEIIPSSAIWEGAHPYIVIKYMADKSEKRDKTV